jgi:hypothetical protein
MKLQHALTVHPKASANSLENMIATALYKIGLAVADLVYYCFIRKRLYTEKPALSPKLSTQSSQNVRS